MKSNDGQQTESQAAVQSVIIVERGPAKEISSFPSPATGILPLSTGPASLATASLLRLLGQQQPSMPLDLVSHLFYGSRKNVDPRWPSVWSHSTDNFLTPSSPGPSTPTPPPPSFPSLQATAVHLFCGSWGGIAPGFFATPWAVSKTYNLAQPLSCGLFYGCSGWQLLVQVRLGLV